MIKHSLLCIAACASKADDKPPPAPPPPAPTTPAPQAPTPTTPTPTTPAPTTPAPTTPAPTTPAPQAPAPTPPAPLAPTNFVTATRLPACHDLPPQPFACREFPFAVDLGNGVTRTDHGTVSDFAVMRDDGKTVWLLEVVPRIAPPTDGELAVQMTKAMHVLATDATLKTKEPQHQIYEATKGVRIELVSDVVEGWVVIRAVAGVKGAANGPGSAPASTYLGPLAHVQPDQGFILDVHGLRLPARAWQFSFSPEKATVYALPDLHATLGVRALAAPCDGLDTDDPKTFVQLRAPTGMTVDTAERVPGAIRVTTKDERPSIYALVCRDKQLIEVGLRGLAITPEMRAMLDQLIQPAGSAIRDDKSSSDRAQ